MATAKKVPAFKTPKTIGACADLLYTTREQRLALQKEVDALQAQETQLKDHIINTLPKSEATGAAGKLARVTVVNDTVPQVEDWEALYKYIKRTGSFELLNKALSRSAAGERLEAGKAIPGVKSMPIVKVSINKV
jgi:hypothetical protein